MIEQKQIWHDYTRYLIADENGSVMIEMYDKVQDWGGTAWIYALWVTPDMRRKGYASKLLKRAEEIAKFYGHKSVFLEWEAKDTPTEIFDWYIRQGYRPTDDKTEQTSTYSLLRKEL